MKKTFILATLVLMSAVAAQAQNPTDEDMKACVRSGACKTMEGAPDASQATVISKDMPANGKIIVDFSEKSEDGFFAIVHPTVAAGRFMLYCKMVRDSERWGNGTYQVPWDVFKATVIQNPLIAELN